MKKLEIAKQYLDIFNQISKGESVEVIVLHEKMLNRMRAALILLKQRQERLVKIFGEECTWADLDISIRRKEKDDKYKYLISLVKKEVTAFAIVPTTVSLKGISHRGKYA